MTHQCKICEKTYCNQTVRDFHIRSVHGMERFSCPLCIVQCKRKDSLRDHIVRMHESDRQGKEQNGKIIDRSKFTFECRVCEKRFGTKETLAIHFRGRHEKAQFQCPECIRVFPWLTSLKIHLKRTHKNSELRYEKKCLEGKMAWQLMKEHQVPESVLPEDDIKNLYSYRHYIQNKIGAYTD